MITICIPVYNCDVAELVKGLHKQAEQLVIVYEILLIDDKSDEPVKERNRELINLPNVIYKELPENIGRAAIRNLLAKEANFRYLIFMDCDAGIYNRDYLRRYAVCCYPGIVCCGGRVNLPEPPGKEYKLRWKYSIKREEINAEERSLHPNDSFLTFNFLIDKEIFNKVTFDEKLRKYGHEDTLFGIELKKNDIPIVHIDNPLLHICLDNAELFINKTEESIKNLIEIQSDSEQPAAFTNSVRLLKTEKKLSRFGLDTLVGYLFPLLKKILLKNLKGNHPNISFFDMYRLAYLCFLRKHN